MADILVTFGRPEWVASRASSIRRVDETFVFDAPKKGEWHCHVACRGGDSPWPGGWGEYDDYWVGWLGHVRDVDEVPKWRVRHQATDVLASRWRAEQEDGLEAVHGCVAGFVFDKRRHALHVFRDKLGKITLAFASHERGIVVSSDHDWLLEARGRPRRPNRHRVRHSIMWTMDWGRDDFHEGVERMFPREVLTCIQGREMQCERYWQPNPDPASDVQRLQSSLTHAFDDVMDDVAEDVPVVSMSGGVDSVLLAAALAERSWPPPLEVASMVAPEMPVLDESDEIRDVERALPIRARRYDVGDDWPLRELDHYTTHPGNGPDCHPGSYATTRFYQHIAESFGRGRIATGVGSIVITGLRHASLRDVVKQGGPRTWLRVLSRESPRVWARLTGSLALDLVAEQGSRLRTLYHEITSRIVASSTDPPWDRAERWLTNPPTSDVDGDSPPGDASLRPLVRRRLRALDSWLWEQSHRQVEKMLRQSGMTFTSPLLDDRLLELGLRIPVSETRYKWPLRQCARSYMPDELALRRPYAAFSPLGEKGLGVREKQRVQDLFRGSRLADAGIIDEESFRESHLAYARTVANKETLDMNYVVHRSLFNTVAVELWLRATE